MPRTIDPATGRFKGDHGGKHAPFVPAPESDVDGIWRTLTDDAAQLPRCYADNIARGNRVWVVRRYGIVIGCAATKREADKMWKRARPLSDSEQKANRR